MILRNLDRDEISFWNLIKVQKMELFSVYLKQQEHARSRMIESPSIFAEISTILTFKIAN